MTEETPLSSPPKAPKLPSEEKQLEACVKALFFQPFIRRLPYLYTLGIDSPYFTIGTDAEKDFHFGNAATSIAVIEILDPEWLTRLKQWFNTLLISPLCLEIIDLSTIAAMCSKVKWKMDQLTIYRGDDQLLYLRLLEGEAKCVSALYTSIFTLNVIQNIQSTYLKMLTDPQSSYVYPYTYQGGPNTQKITISKTDLNGVLSGYYQKQDLQLLVTRGLDLIETKHLSPDESKEVALRFMPIDGQSILYGHSLTTAQYRMIESRCHMFLIPR